ncbi:repressor LexA [SAR202 cluster bacterium AD-493-K16_JPT_193m]|nr:repressor LexA [SAR202 cluster bacterium AD-493-K16_JPT_193m]
MKGLSRKQNDILGFVEDFIRTNSYPPTVRDIQYGCNISSTSVVDYNLRILTRKGHIRRAADVSRGIGLTSISEGLPPNLVPLLGFIAAGEPLALPTQDGLTKDDAYDHIELPTAMLAGIRLRGTTDLYALRVRGTSMIDALVDDGDLVVIQPASSVMDGEMAVAWLKDKNEATLKRIYNEGTVIRLQPANVQMAPFFVSPENLEIQGRVVGVLRTIS